MESKYMSFTRAKAFAEWGGALTSVIWHNLYDDDSVAYVTAEEDEALRSVGELSPKVKDVVGRVVRRSR